MSFQARHDALKRRWRELNMRRHDAIGRQDLHEAMRLRDSSHFVLRKMSATKARAASRGVRIKFGD